MSRPARKYEPPPDSPMGRAIADMHRTVTIGEIAKAHKVDVHTAAAALPMTPAHGAYPFNPAPTVERKVTRTPVTLSPDEADAVADELARLLSELQWRDKSANHRAGVVLDRAMNKLRPGSVS